MRTIVSLVLLLIMTLPSAWSETWIAVNKHIHRVKPHTNCKWLAIDPQSTCDCCLIKNAIVRRQNPKLAMEQCANSHECTFNEPGTSEDEALRLVKNAEKSLRSISIVRVEKLAFPPELPKNGVLTGENVANILEALARENYLSLPKELLAHNELGNGPLKVKSLSETNKGLFTGQLFAITYDPYYIDPSVVDRGLGNKPLFILKETKKGVDEIEHLYRINVSSLANEKISTNDRLFHQGLTSQTIASIAFDDLHFKLSTNGKTRYFSLLQTAPGQSLKNHLRSFGEVAATKDIDDVEFQVGYRKIKNIFYRIGFSMSELHQKHALLRDKRKFAHKKTLTHGDLHAENIFYDEVTDQVTLIDNETFALSLKKPASGVEDLVEMYTLHTIHTVAHRFSTQLTTNTEFGISDSLWHDLWRILIQGYLDAYGELSKEDFLQLFNSVRKEFFDGFSQRKIFKSLSDFKDQRRLKRFAFGGSKRRTEIRIYELKRTFDRILKNGLKKYDASVKLESSIR